MDLLQRLLLWRGGICKDRSRVSSNAQTRFVPSRA
jgi:hypothetical protein